jgi:hypothetical protein
MMYRGRCIHESPYLVHLVYSAQVTFRVVQIAHIYMDGYGIQCVPRVDVPIVTDDDECGYTRVDLPVESGKCAYACACVKEYRFE